MKKIGAFFARVTRDDFKVNAFYDVGLKIILLITVTFKLFGVFRFLMFKPIYSLFLLDFGIAILLFAVCFVINLIKRRKNQHTENIINRGGVISAILSIIGGSCFLIEIYLVPESVTLLLISTIFVVGSIGFYLLGYKQARKNLHFEKIA